jgi:hypothetical protein
MTKLALYFGYGAGGHFLRGNGRRDSLVPKRDYPGFPWTISHLDTGLLRNGKIPDKPDGRIFWTCVGSDVATDLWYAFYWWDRSGDSRPGSNSGFYVHGFSENEILAALSFACAAWPEIIARQAFPLTLVNPLDTP